MDDSACREIIERFWFKINIEFYLLFGRKYINLKKKQLYSLLIINLFYFLNSIRVLSFIILKKYIYKS
jgi:hypothetical protein